MVQSHRTHFRESSCALGTLRTPPLWKMRCVRTGSTTHQMREQATHCRCNGEKLWPPVEDTRGELCQEARLCWYGQREANAIVRGEKFSMHTNSRPRLLVQTKLPLKARPCHASAPHVPQKKSTPLLPRDQRGATVQKDA